MVTIIIHPHRPAKSAKHFQVLLKLIQIKVPSYKNLMLPDIRIFKIYEVTLEYKKQIVQVMRKI